MKNVFFTLLFLALNAIAFAQTTAQDFTKIECGSTVSHNLFTELDAGNCIFIEFAMMPTCSGCITAGKAMEKVKKTVNAKYPSKMKYYLMEWSGAKTCTEMAAWEKTNGITTTLLPAGNTEVDFYGGIGMPTLVLLGGKDHKVLWKKLGFANSDTTKIKTAIDAFFKVTGTNDEIQTADLKVSPNPASNEINLTVANSDVKIEQVEIFNIVGERVATQVWQANTTNTFNIAALPQGAYLLQLLDKNNNQVGVKRFVKE